MELTCRRRAFCVLSRYRLCGRFSSTASSSPLPPPPAFSQMQSVKLLRSAMAMHSSLAVPPPSALFTTRNYTAPAFIAGKCPCCFTYICTSRCGCSCATTSGLLFSARNCTTTAYPPPTPPGEFKGGDEEVEADGAPLNVDETAEEGALPPEDFDMPPFDANDAEDDGDYVDEDPPPDPEEALLFSPSDSD